MFVRYPLFILIYLLVSNYTYFPHRFPKCHRRKKNGEEVYIELGLSEVFLDNGDRMFCGFVRGEYSFWDFFFHFILVLPNSIDET